MRNTFIFSILLLIVVSLFSCSKEQSVRKPNEIIGKWRIKSVMIDSLGPIDTSFRINILKRPDSIDDIGTIEFIEGFEPNTGTWIESMYIDTFRRKKADTTFRVFTGAFKVGRQEVYRFLSNSADTLEIKVKGDSLILTKETPRVDTADRKRITKINCIKS